MPERRREVKALQITGFSDEEISEMRGLTYTAVISGRPVNIAVVLRSDVGDMSLMEASLVPFVVRREGRATRPRLLLLPPTSSAQRPRGGARSRRTGQDGAVGRLVRRGLEPRRLASGAVGGVVIGVISLLMLGSEGPKAVFYIGVALMVVLTAPWILSVLYLRTERGRAARDEYLARSRDEYLAGWEHSRRQTRDQAE